MIEKVKVTLGSQEGLVVAAALVVDDVVVRLARDTEYKPRSLLQLMDTVPPDGISMKEVHVYFDGMIAYCELEEINPDLVETIGLVDLQD